MRYVDVSFRQNVHYIYTVYSNICITLFQQFSGCVQYKILQVNLSSRSANPSKKSVQVHISSQGLTRKEKIHIDYERCARINILANKIVT